MRETRLIVHGHRAMHAAMTRNKKHGISMLVFAKLLRLAGIDQLHTGTVIGKMESRETPEINNFLRNDWHGLRTTLPVASGGLHPGVVPKLVKILGKDIVIQAGGGIHGHPDGTKAGAAAMRQAIDATMEGIPLIKYAKKHNELKMALKRWKS
jgi:ribulose-bisphosphate carboxylase large chain